MTNPIQGWPYGIDGRAAINLTTDRRETTRELIRLRQLLNQTRAALHVALHHATCTDPSETRPAELSGCRFALQEATDFLEESA